MTKRFNDKRPAPTGGRAAERLRMFEEARLPTEASENQEKKPAKNKKTQKARKEPNTDEN